MKSKKALSSIVSIILIIALVIVIGGIIFGVVKGVAEKNLGKAESCFNLFEKITLNQEYTCYNSTGEYMQFSLDRKEINFDSVLIAINTWNETILFSLTDSVENIPGLNNYPDNNTGVKLPGNSSGLTYIASGITSIPTLIEIAPVRGGTGCEVIDEISTILICA